jgi:uncharacterized protein (DUF488 family)
MSSILTIGHSTRPLEAFVELLRARGVARLIDVRTVPRSRRVPQFNRESLPEALAAAGVAYSHMPGLGGLRKPRKDSPNCAWRNESFRGYADYMLTPEFEAAVEELLAAAGREQVAIMCAEAVPWRCHRSLISDALTARGVDVLHIVNAGPPQRHAMTSFAQVDGKRVTYPPAPSLFGGAIP